MRLFLTWFINRSLISNKKIEDKIAKKRKSQENHNKRSLYSGMRLGQQFLKNLTVQDLRASLIQKILILGKRNRKTRVTGFRKNCVCQTIRSNRWSRRDIFKQVVCTFAGHIFYNGVFTKAYILQLKRKKL